MKASRSDTPAPLGQGIEQRSELTQIPSDSPASEFHLSKVMDTIPGLVWCALPNGAIEFCNQKWLHYTGMSLNEVQAADWAAALHPEDRHTVRDK